jgi:hypothetical protein
MLPRGKEASALLRVALAMVAAAGAVTILVVLPNRGSRRRIPAASWPTGSPDAHFVGGATWRAGAFPFGASWPLVALDLYPERLVVRPTAAALVWVIPRIELAWSDVELVEKRPTGVRITRSDRSEATILFQMGRDVILRALAAYPVRTG